VGRGKGVLAEKRKRKKKRERFIGAVRKKEGGKEGQPVSFRNTGGGEEEVVVKKEEGARCP